VQRPFRELVNIGFIQWLKAESTKAIGLEGEPDFRTDLDDFEKRGKLVLQGAQTIAGGDGGIEAIASEMRGDLKALLALPSLRRRWSSQAAPELHDALDYLLAGPRGHSPFAPDEPMTWSGLYSWIACRRMGAVTNPPQTKELSRSWLDEWQLAKIITEVFQGLGVDRPTAERGTSLVKLLTSYGGALPVQTPQGTELGEDQSPAQILHTWLSDAELQHLLGFNRYQSILWFNKESFDEWIWWAFASAVIDLVSQTADGQDEKVFKLLIRWYHLIQRLRQAAQASDYQVEKLLEVAKGS
jgi:hypothetical protein